MYVRPAKTQVSLCIDPLYKASFSDSPESEEGAYCMISEGSDPGLDSLAVEVKYDPQRYDQWMLRSEYAVAQIDPSLHSSHKVFLLNP